MHLIINDGVVIIERDIVITKGNQLTKYNVSHRGLMTMTENNHLIIRAFALAFKYKEVYERTGNVRLVAKAESASPMTIYRYLNLAYMNPTKINDIMFGKTKCTVDELFKIASENQLC